MKAYRHTIHLVNGKTIAIDTESECLEFSSYLGFVYLRLTDGSVVTQIPMNSVLYITSEEVQI